jgi:DNA-binding MarR family transcriptional regulator
MPDKPDEGKSKGRPALAFLIAQVGGHAAIRFGERLKRLKLAPPAAGILWKLSIAGGMSQKDLSAALGIHPSRLVAVLDALEACRLVERTPNEDDRRQYALHLTEKARQTLAQIGKIAREHADSLFAALSATEREQLGELLQRVADEQGLTRGVHPGYRSLRPGSRGKKSSAPSARYRRER